MQPEGKADVVGVIGLGRMGQAMATRLLDRGWTVLGFDVNPARLTGITNHRFTAGDSAAGVAARAPLLLTSVFDGPQLIGALRSDNGILEGASTDTLLIDTSTIDPDTSRLSAQLCAEHDVRFMRATVSGNPDVARSGSLGMFCSGNEADYRASKALLDDLAAQHQWLGPGEESRYAKLVVNLVVTGTNVLLAEAMGIAEAAGISREDFLDCIQGSVAGSRFTEYKGKALLANDYTPTMTPGEVRKDLGYILAAARDLDISVPATAIVDQVYALTETAGFGDLDFGAAALLHRAAHDSWVRAKKEANKGDG